MIYSHLLHVHIFERENHATWERKSDRISKDHARRHRMWWTTTTVVVVAAVGCGENSTRKKNERKYDFEYSMNMK